jgi:hypothetical protein
MVLISSGLDRVSCYCMALLLGRIEMKFGIRHGRKKINADGK